MREPPARRGEPEGRTGANKGDRERRIDRLRHDLPSILLRRRPGPRCVWIGPRVGDR